MYASIGIDLGSDRTRIYSGDSVVLDLPSCVAIKNHSSEAFAFGEEAQKMMGKTSEYTQVIAPIERGVIASYNEADAMLKNYLGRVCGNKMIKPRVLVAMPAGLTAVQMRSVMNAVRDAGGRSVCLVEAPIAVAVALDIDFSTPHGTVIIDIGAGTTDIAVLSMGSLAACESARCAGMDFDEAIIRYVRRIHNINIGPRTARQIKERIGCVSPRPVEIAMKAKGVHIYTGRPEVFEITANEICEAVSDVMDTMVRTVQQVLEKTPPELVADMAKDGVFLTGGGSLMHGMVQALQERLGVRIRPVSDPLQMVARGAGKAMRQFSALRRENDYRLRQLKELIVK
ncbi:MAG: rod shape-determining protein [Clostridia bacterium]|nr:rod shape-determining protein [Clostridia bacterium]